MNTAIAFLMYNSLVKIEVGNEFYFSSLVTNNYFCSISMDSK